MVSGGEHNWFGICCFSLCCGCRLHNNNHFSLQSFHAFTTLLTACMKKMSLYFASSLDIISLTMPTPDDEAVNAVMGDQGEIDTPDPMSLGDQIDLRDAMEDDIIAVSSLTYTLASFKPRPSRSRLLVAVFCRGLLLRAMAVSIICLSFSFDRSQIQTLTPLLLMMGAYSGSPTLVPRGFYYGFHPYPENTYLGSRPDDIPAPTQITAGALWDLATTQPAGGAPHKARIFLRRYEIAQEYSAASVGMVCAPAGIP